MKLMKEISFRTFIILVMLSLAFVAWDMSQPVLQQDSEILTQDVVECLVQPFSSVFDDEGTEEATQGINFLWNILLPIIIYLISIGGFMYLLIDDLKLMNVFTQYNKIARFFWILWIVSLILMLLIPLFFGIQLLMKGFVLAVIATGVFLILMSILYSVSKPQNKRL